MRNPSLWATAIGAATLTAIPVLAQNAPEAPAKPTPPPATIDTDGDGVMDAWDQRGDGKPDTWDTDGDGKPDAFDQDGDGAPDPKAEEKTEAEPQ
ncbi:MAG: hypothetical protein ABJN65_05345 [Parasphingorhabdus sp.]